MARGNRRGSGAFGIGIQKMRAGCPHGGETRFRFFGVEGNVGAAGFENSEDAGDEADGALGVQPDEIAHADAAFL